MLGTEKEHIRFAHRAGRRRSHFEGRDDHTADVLDDLPTTESAVAAEERVADEQESAAVLAGVAPATSADENGKVG